MIKLTDFDHSIQICHGQFIYGQCGTKGYQAIEMLENNSQNYESAS